MDRKGNKGVSRYGERSCRIECSEEERELKPRLRESGELGENSGVTKVELKLK